MSCLSRHALNYLLTSVGAHLPAQQYWPNLEDHTVIKSSPQAGTSEVDPPSAWAVLNSTSTDRGGSWVLLPDFLFAKAQNFLQNFSPLSLLSPTNQQQTATLQPLNIDTSFPPSSRYQHSHTPRPHTLPLPPLPKRTMSAPFPNVVTVTTADGRTFDEYNCALECKLATKPR